MHRTRAGLLVALTACLGMACSAVWAAGFGAPATSVWLGQVLDYEVPLRLSPGETVEPGCVAAAVVFGERSLPPTQVSTQLERRADALTVVRVVTSAVVDEPVVTVQVDIGCQLRISRTFVVLADPPGLPAPVAPQRAVSDPVAVGVGSLPDARLRAAGVAQAVGQTRETRQTREPRARRAATPAGAQSATTRAAADAAKPRAAAAPAARSVAAPTPRLRLDVAPAVPTPAAAAATAAATAAAAAELAAVEEALAAVSAAASAVRDARAAAAAAEERAQGLERTVQQLRAEAQAQAQTTAQMSQRLARSQAVSNWVWPLVVGLLALAGLAVWMAWQLASLRREREQGWAAVSAGASGAGMAAVPHGAGPDADLHGMPATPQEGSVAAGAARPADTLGSAPSTSPAAVPSISASGLARRAGADGDTGAAAMGTAGWPAGSSGDTTPALLSPWQPPRPTFATTATSSPSAGLAPLSAALSAPDTVPQHYEGSPVPPSQRTMPQPPPASTVPRLGEMQPAARDLSIEELIDLEQQAEFFIVLGQDEAAIDLLVEHIRSTGGASPLPYLKLLEVYRRQGEREAYERTRVRFNQRFNAYAPDWAVDPAHGRSLGAYPEVLPRLIQVWPKPLDAMAELEALLFRKTDGELFDLPAYRELLFLYALARDLLDREAATTGNVDLLLPLADEREFGVTSPHPYFGLEHDSVFDRQSVEDSPTSPVDFDLAPAPAVPRIFDPLTAGRLPLHGQTDIDGSGVPDTEIGPIRR